jgi:hypothetical protein
MSIILRMAGIAIGRRTQKVVILMAAIARDGGMFSGQVKADRIMVECGRAPTGSGVTGGTIRTQLTFMGIILGMTGIAIRRSVLEDEIVMTTGASYTAMRSC